MKTSYFIMLCLAVQLSFGLQSTEAVSPTFSWSQHVPKEGMWIYVNLSKQQVSVGKGNDANQKPLLVSSCSTGRRGHATPSGVMLKVISKVEHDKSNTYGASMPFNLRLGGAGSGKIQDGEYGIHASKHAKWPSPLSHGCIRVPEENARWLFSNVPVGTPVFIDGSVDEYYRDHFCPEDLLVIKGDEIIGFKVAYSNATQADYELFLKALKAKEIPLRYDPNGKMSSDKRVVRFMWPFMPASAGLTVSKFESIFPIPIKIERH